jgi:HAD superfamily hydrolase (TIGR01490 family)
MSGSHENGRIAAFFDLDGTLLPLPSLERRFVAALRYRRAIPAMNYVRWMAHAVRMVPQGIPRIAHANKMYLHNVVALSSTGTPACAAAAHATVASGSTHQYSAPRFFPAGIDRVAWHVRQGHTVILTTGTLEPLAQQAALALTLRLVARGLTASIGVCATRLEKLQDRWTGRIEGEAMFAEAKTRAMQRIAAQCGFNLSLCYAYGDTASDRWMLGAVGWPTAVNPSRELERISQLRRWPILRWSESSTSIAAGATEESRSHTFNCTAVPDIHSETLG